MPRQETSQVCHALLQNTKFLQLLLKMDTELAAIARADGCRCGGVLHRGNYPRKLQCCPDEVYSDFDWHYIFDCNICRKRTTPVSVRFLGRRVYLGLAVVLMYGVWTEATSAVAKLSGITNVPAHTIQRWRKWWAEEFSQEVALAGGLYQIHATGGVMPISSQPARAQCRRMNIPLLSALPFLGDISGAHN